MTRQNYTTTVTISGRRRSGRSDAQLLSTARRRRRPRTAVVTYNLRCHTVSPEPSRPPRRVASPSRRRAGPTQTGPPIRRGRTTRPPSRSPATLARAAREAIPTARRRPPPPTAVTTRSRCPTGFTGTVTPSKRGRPGPSRRPAVVPTRTPPSISPLRTTLPR